LQQQHNKSFNLTSPALRGGRHSGAVKRAPQVNSNPLGCLLLMDVENGIALLWCGRRVRRSAFSEFSCGKWFHRFQVCAFAIQP